MAGEFFNVQLGFGYAEILDPVTQTSLPVISTLKNLLGMLSFFDVRCLSNHVRKSCLFF